MDIRRNPLDVAQDVLQFFSEKDVDYTISINGLSIVLHIDPESATKYYRDLRKISLRSGVMIECQPLSL